MLKAVPLLTGIVATATIIQPSVAMNTPNLSSSLASKQPSSDLYAQIILNIGHSPSWRERRWERERERERELARERHERWEREHRREREHRWDRDRERYEHRYY
ncbi:hypothetical protein G7B40_012930 [Aetokthonos hydrillicola Thurmond2011]|jgi:hypothetical protein|uniref:Uncharacterized protein n=1 Tax=Aetokthonos hydrillicola Thurmond2011 TaxID=2712845 RepID=A0AAP5I817_9CYAN|nr:hypothetical protein [Aetokthonos hydrillicola]MBO3459477.1 hypothetical protein [Aetokthonos hydrillicola CCALA 1050]MBW4583840.1 hypothetical protein [Aetokthonos hydrillicola CCALA 1050]MDR9895464.1 hypothetical protein [Aetokthonos hydrillicola Thurmond2011]